ncbi:NADH dehydrogenase [ubiquinone] 1 alpha subcomplex assembly factor 2 [Engraulis encrasicolus]|uniref:NADH dehydrogenase [ubiquinone] 1 alpha subcomplex assembly factor 2 n=1 Tax=Engraulis encrasicolus TaxID=184585 RepID=UPI002FCFE8D1
MSRFTSVLRRTFGVVKELVGTDHLGNKYYIIPEQKTWTGRVVGAKRLVVASNPNEFEYLEGNIPSEWDAWIRGRRKEPPTFEELLKNERYREHIKEKAREVDERDLALQAKEYEEGLVSRPTQTTLAKGHAASTAFGKPEVTEDPVSTGSSFQPGSWMPQGSKQTTQAKGHAASTAFGKPEVSEDPVSTGGSFQPGSWMPPGAKK